MLFWNMVIGVEVGGVSPMGRSPAAVELTVVVVDLGEVGMGVADEGTGEVGVGVVIWLTV